ncbi:MAG: DNA-directed DNA polymerase [Nanoarchaeota archaeon]|nr:DNA-directed DNA polymerase [Nanoarchaeota archaeon]
METDFIPLDYDYFDFQGRNYVKIFGRNSKGKRICVIDSCPIYFWAILEHGLGQRKIDNLMEKITKIKLDIKGRKTKVEAVELQEKNFLGKPVKALKIFATNYKDLHDIADRLGFKEIVKRRGYDLGFITHYILEKKINPLQWYLVSGQVLNNSLEFGGVDSNLDVDFCIKLESAKRTGDLGFKPKILTYDIETDDIKLGEGKILMVSLVSENFKKVITWRKKSEKKLDYVEYVKDEADLIEAFVSYVKKISPDFIVGYFSDGFDMPYMKIRAEKNNVKLSLSLDGSQPRFSRGIEVSAKTKGIVHVDLLKFIRTAYSQYMQSETLSLNEVSKEFLGDKKKDFKHKHSSQLDDAGWDNYFEYNLHDSVLVYGLFEKMWPDVLEFTRIMNEPVAEVSRNGMSKNVESFIIHNLERFNEIPEKRPTHDEIGERRRKEKYVGAFVFEPTPGLYEDIAVFDFTSSYGSTIVTYNLSRSTLLEKPKKGEDSYSIEIENKKVYFSKKPGFFPEMLKEMIEKRKRYKAELQEKPDVIKRARSNAFKLLANAAYGYQGFFGARYYSREAAAATAAFARKSIKDSIEKINGHGYRVIYSDTDSIAFLTQRKTEQETKEFLEHLNSDLPGIMELELEGFFKRGLWVTKRTGTIGAKKKYALLGKDGKVKIRGFETVRRDWCSLARKTQNEIIRMVLQDGNEKRAVVLLKEIIKRVKQREVQREEIIIKTMLQKPLSEYKAISPHVIAARKMQEREIPISGGNLIEYFIAETREKKKLVREKVKLPDEKGEYNIEYYLKKQILPAAENILQVFGINVNEIIEGKRQTKLGDF